MSNRSPGGSMLVVPPSEIPSNSRLGKYQVLRRFARGGMADLYLGYLAGTLGAFRRLVVLKRTAAARCGASPAT